MTTTTPASDVGRRYDLFDAMRLISIFGVICLHQKFPDPEVLSPGGITRLSVRWCVPFFFMLTGFFLKSRAGFADAGGARLTRVTLTMLVANLFYLPLSLLLLWPEGFRPEMLVTGTWFHLWFLSAMVMGFLLIEALPFLVRSPAGMSALSLVLLLLVVGGDYADVFWPAALTQPMLLLRQLQAVAFLWIGFWLAQNVRALPGAVTSLCMAGAGLLACYADAWFFSSLGYGAMDRLLPPGAVLTAVGLVCWCAKGRVAAWSLRLAPIGSAHVLTIYVIHPLFLKVASVMVSRIGVAGNPAAFASIALCVATSLVAALILAKIWPAAGGILQGRISPPGITTSSAERVA